MRLEKLRSVDSITIGIRLCFTTFKTCTETVFSLSHQHCKTLSTSFSTHLIMGVSLNCRRKRRKENLTDLHSCHEWSSDHLQSHQLDVLSYPKSLLSYHSYTLGILMMALLFAVISGNSMTYLPGSWAKWTRQASLKIMIMETEGKIGIVLKFTHTFHVLLSFHLAASHFQRRDKNTHEMHSLPQLCSRQHNGM